MRTALFGGSCNPVHNGHVLLVKKVMGTFNIERTIIMPTYSTPLKDNSDFADSGHRYNMCRIAFRDHPNVYISDLEIKRGGKSYTYITLNELKKIYYDDELFLLVGADMFLTMQNWMKPKEIFSSAKIIVTPREGSESDLQEQAIELSRLGCDALFMTDKIMNISSTVIRDKLSKGESVDGLIDIENFKYIKNHHLYGT